MKIQVAYTDRFRKTFRSLKSDDQKAIDQAIDDWIAKPDNTSSHFEKLPFMGDNIFSIRSSRAGRVIMAKFDGVFFLLHADDKQHDKANDWAKNKRIDRNSITGAIQIYTDPVEVIDQSSNPQPEGEETPIFNNCTPEQLKVIGVPEGWINKLLVVTTEEEYEQLWEYLPDDAIDNLESVRSGFDIRNLVMQIKDEQAQEIVPIVEQVIRQPGFDFITEDQSLAEVLKKDISVFRYFLHPTQKFLIENTFKGPVKLTGTAGTGKTVAAIHKAKKLAENLPEGSKPILFTTFTKYLIKNIRSIFEEAKIPGDKLVISNLHHFAMQFSQQLELLQGQPNIIEERKDKSKLWEKFCKLYTISKYSPEFLQDEYRNVVQEMHVINKNDYLIIARAGQGDRLVKSEREKLWEVFTNFESFQRSENEFTFEDICFRLNKYLEQWPDLKPFSHVICDEIQDFSNLELRLLRSLVPFGDNDMFLSGDPFQNIYQKQINFSRSSIQIRGRSFRLRKNYRTTDEIQKIAFSALSNNEFLGFDGEVATLTPCESIIYGEDPQVKMFESDEQEFAFLASYVRENFGHLGLHEICFATRLKDKRDALKEFFISQNFTCVNLEDVDDLKDTEGRIVLSTLHGLKGLEFKSLVIFSLSNRTFPFKPRSFNSFSENQKSDYLKSEHALLYVSFSRAISNLVITGVGDKLPWLV